MQHFADGHTFFASITQAEGDLLATARLADFYNLEFTLDAPKITDEKS